jgi:hypothetical protein
MLFFGIGPTVIFDGLAFGIVAIGLWKRLRTAAVAALLLFAAGSALQALSRQGPWNPLFAALFLLAFVNAARGTFRYRALLKRPQPAVSTQKSPLLAVFSAVRWINSLRRKVFGPETPQWFDDLQSYFISWINMVELIPTVWTILFFPTHFFHRVPEIIKKRHSGYDPPYRSEFEFGLNLIVLTFLGDKLLYHRLGYGELTHASFAVFCVSLPLLLPLASLLFWLIAAPSRITLRYSGIYINSVHLLTVVDPASYSRMSFSKRWRGLIYYYEYALCIPQIATVFAAGMLFLAFARTGLPDTSMSGYAPPLVVVVVLLLDRVFIVPYSELLRVSVKYPTRRMHQSDIQRLTGALGHCEYLLQQYVKAKNSTSGSRERKLARLRKQIDQVLETGVQNGWIAAEQRLRQDRRLESDLDEKELARFHFERSSVYSGKAFSDFQRLWEQYDQDRKLQFAFVNDLLQMVRAVAGQPGSLATSA